MNRLRTPDYALGVAGAALLISLWCPWYKVLDGTVSGWRALSIIDLWLALAALLALAAVVETALRDEPALPVALDVLTWFAGLIGIPLVLFRLLDAPGGLDRSWGVVLAALATLGTFAGAHWAMRTEAAPGLRPAPEIRAMPAPPVVDPATPPT